MLNFKVYSWLQRYQSLESWFKCVEKQFGQEVADACRKHVKDTGQAHHEHASSLRGSLKSIIEKAQTELESEKKEPEQTVPA